MVLPASMPPEGKAPKNARRRHNRSHSGAARFEPRPLPGWPPLATACHPIYAGTDGRGIPLVGVFLSNCDLTPAGLAPIAAGLARCDTRRLKTLRVNGVK